jgi:hypothetical protein
MPDILLTKHQGMEFADHTIYVTGHAYINCTFARCTLVWNGGPSRVEHCRFQNCNWRIEYDVLWGDPSTRSALRQLIDLIDGALDSAGDWLRAEE